MEMKIKNNHFTLLLGLLIVTITIIALMLLESRQHREPIIVLIDPSKPTIALTFDDGPNASYTPQVLDILYKYNVPATFFISGKNLGSNEKLLRGMIQDGHELGNHTYSHADLTTLDRDEIIKEVKLTQEMVEKIVPNYKLNYVRPPYGRYNETVENAINDPIVLWDIDSGDWTKTDVQNICNNVLSSINDGDIVIFHDDNNLTVNALSKIIPELKKRGFQFVTLSYLYQAEDSTE